MKVRIATGPVGLKDRLLIAVILPLIAVPTAFFVLVVCLGSGILSLFGLIEFDRGE